jgi:hypothetical protein
MYVSQNQVPVSWRPTFEASHVSWFEHPVYRSIREKLLALERSVFVVRAMAYYEQIALG